MWTTFQDLKRITELDRFIRTIERSKKQDYSGEFAFGEQGVYLPTERTRVTELTNDSDN